MYVLTEKYKDNHEVAKIMIKYFKSIHSYNL